MLYLIKHSPKSLKFLVHHHLTAIKTPEKSLKILEFSSYTSICNSFKSRFWLLKRLGGEVIRWRRDF